jgi:Uncharacterized conserved protein
MDLFCPSRRRTLRPIAAWRVRRAGSGGSTARYDYKEHVGDDLDVKVALPFPCAMKLKPGETVIFAWIMFKSRAHRDRVNAKVMKDPRLDKIADPKAVPFDVKRMAYGGFKILVNA